MTESIRLAQRVPTIAAGLVTNPEADAQNAWDVLAAAFGEREAARLVRAFPHPRATRTATDVLADLGVTL